MNVSKYLGLVALAVAVFVGTSDHATASYTYSTQLSIVGGTQTATGSTITVGGTTVTLVNITSPSFTVPSTNTVDIGDIIVSTTTPLTSSDTFTVSYSDSITLVNTPPPGSAATSPPGSFVLTGTLTLTGINTGAGVITNVFTGTTSRSGPFADLFFSGSVLNFASPTVNGGSGSFGGLLVSSLAIPAPASLVMLGLGLGGVGLIRLRTRRGQQA
jgi:hypothetical protein